MMIYLMNKKCIARTTEPKDLKAIKGIILPEIEEAIKASSGVSAHKELMNYHDKSAYSITMIADSKPIAIFGIMEISANRGLGWVFTSTEVNKYKKTFYEFIKFLVCYFAHEYSSIEGFIDTRFTKSVKFFERLGFDIGEPELLEDFNFKFVRVSFRGDKKCLSL